MSIQRMTARRNLEDEATRLTYDLLALQQEINTSEHDYVNKPCIKCEKLKKFQSMSVRLIDVNTELKEAVC